MNVQVASCSSKRHARPRRESLSRDRVDERHRSRHRPRLGESRIGCRSQRVWDRFAGRRAARLHRERFRHVGGLFGRRYDHARSDRANDRRYYRGASAGLIFSSTMPASSMSLRIHAISDRKMGCDPCNQPFLGISHASALRAPGDAPQRLRPHHQHRLGARFGRLAVQSGLCRRQARHRRPDQGYCAGDCGGRASPATQSAPVTSTRHWSRHRSRDRPSRTAFRASRSFATCCLRSNRTSASPPPRNSALSRCFLRAPRRRRSPE